MRVQTQRKIYKTSKTTLALPSRTYLRKRRLSGVTKEEFKMCTANKYRKRAKSSVARLRVRRTSRVKFSTYQRHTIDGPRHLLRFQLKKSLRVWGHHTAQTNPCARPDLRPRGHDPHVDTLSQGNQGEEREGRSEGRCTAIESQDLTRHPPALFPLRNPPSHLLGRNPRHPFPLMD